MALVFYNPHKNVMLGLTVMNWLNKSKLPLKYNYLLELLRKGEAKIYCDNKGTSFPFQSNGFNKYFRYIELYFWKKINKISKAECYYDYKKINKEDFLFFFAYDFLQTKISIKNKSVLNIDCNKLVHFSHYFFRTIEISQNLSSYDNVYIIAECDLKKNSPFFQKYFNWYDKNVYVLPFVVSERFVDLNIYSNRINKCLAVGSFMTMDKADYNECMLDYLNSDTIQPIRKEIYLNKSKLTDYIECRIDYINEFWNLHKTKIQGKESVLSKIINIYKKKIKNNWGKSNHFKANIVDLYNSYKMVFSSDDAGELPSISFFEAMVCGCVNIAVPTANLLDIGLIEGIHYIGFDGTLQNLVEKIEYYQKNQDELNEIAKNGNLFSKKRFLKDYVLENFNNNFIEKF
jgi:hypothetical protein